MTTDREPDIEQMWRQQPSDGQTIRPEEIRRRAADFDQRSGRWRLVGGLTFALLLVKNAWEVWRDTDVIERAGDSLMVLALLYVAYRFWRHARAAIPSVLGATSCREHYRARLMRQHDLSRDGWKFVLPFAPGMWLIVVGRALEGRPATQVAFLIGLSLVLFAGALWVIARSGRRLEREIAGLD